MAGRDETCEAILDKIGELLLSIDGQTQPAALAGKSAAIKDLAEARAWIRDVSHAKS